MDCGKEYNKFEAIKVVTKNIVNYLILNNEDLWKLLYYIKDNELPLSQENLTTQQKIAMISTNPYDINENTTKNILFQTTAVDETFITAIPQIRIEIGDIIPTDRVRGYIEIIFQIIVPNKQELFTTSYNNVASRSTTIFMELAKSLNGTFIKDSYLKSELFLDRSSSAGRKTGAINIQYNKEYTGRWCTFSVLI